MPMDVAADGTPRTAQELKEALKAMMAQKQRLEEGIAVATEVLESTPAGTDGPLIDREGFPRGDCDLWAVRTNRNQRSCLTNDHKALMRDIATHLDLLHEALRREGLVQAPEPATAPAADAPTKDPIDPLLAECKALPGVVRVETVTAQSPAAAAGLQPGDLIVSFHGIRAPVQGPLTLIGECVRDHVGQPLRLVVRRNRDLQLLTLTPDHWAGPGLLGCRVVPAA